MSFLGSSTRVASEAGAGGDCGGGETLGPSSSGSPFLDDDLVDFATDGAFFEAATVAAGAAMVTGAAWKSCAA